MESKWQIFKEFDRLGKLLFQQGLVSLTAGNLSVRKGNSIYITASGSMLGDLKFEDVVVLPLNSAEYSAAYNLKKPSVEAIVHRSIYDDTSHMAVVHAHAPTAIAFSFTNERIVLADSEGKFYVPEVPVIAVNGGIASLDVAKEIPSLLNKYPAVIVRGHGIFSAADTLVQACSIVSTIEFSLKILQKKEIFKK